MSTLVHSSLRTSIYLARTSSAVAQFPIRRLLFPLPQALYNMPPKRKRSFLAATAEIPHETSILPPNISAKPSPLTKRQSSRRAGVINTNPDQNADIVDGKTALRASPNADEKGESLNLEKVSNVPPPAPITPAKTNGVKRGGAKKEASEFPLSDVPELAATPNNGKRRKTPTKSSIAAKKASNEIKAFKAEQVAKKAAEAAKIKKEDGEDEWDKRQDPDGDEEGPAEDVDVLKKEAARPPPVNSDYLPLPWKGRLGYVSISQ